MNSTKFLSHIGRFALLALTAMAAHASVVYQFSGIPNNNDGGLPQAFELVVPDFLQIPVDSQQEFSCGQLSIALNCEGGVIFSTYINPRPFTASLQFNDMGGRQYYYSFATGAFTQVGTYYSDPFGYAQFDQAVLTVSLRTESPGPHVPEPQSVLLACSAFALFAVKGLRRKGRRT